jgi:type IV pilus assembly protein PilW
MRAPDRHGASHRLPAGPPARGVSLIELLVGTALGLLLVTVMLRGFAASSGNAAVNALVSEYQTNGRYALELLRREVRHAALSPLMWDAVQLDINAAAAARDFGCGAGVSTAVFEGLRAINDGNPYGGSCLANAGDRKYLRGDVLTLRRLGLDAVGVYLTNAPYARVSYGAGNLFLGGETPIPLPDPSFVYPVLNDVYFVNDFTTSPTELPKVPALYRLRLSPGANPTLVPELVASNVEHMQWQFGVADGAGNVRYLNPQAVTDWSTVQAARVWLLMRASVPESGLASGSYSMGDVTYAPADNFRRVVLSSTIDLRNR